MSGKNVIVRFKDQPAIELATARGDRAMVLLHGAQVVSWVAANGTERLYLSARSAYGSGAVVRGGVPVIFPQFNQRGPDFNVPRHGFVRTLPWSLEQASASTVTLRLADNEQSRRLWPHAFALTVTVRLESDRLEMSLGVANTGAEPLAFTAALHTYLAVGDISQTSVSGLGGVRFLDTVSLAEGTGSPVPLRFEGETDAIWLDLPSALRMDSPAGALDVAMEGFKDAVIWNPWARKCALLPDMPDDDFRRMLCIEAAAIGKPVTLAPAGTWLGRQILSAV